MLERHAVFDCTGTGGLSGQDSVQADAIAQCQEIIALRKWASEIGQQRPQTLLDRLQSPQRLWTPIGLSTVDQTAPYYRHDGYWNGAVWMPHQWFLWKTMLDLGQADFAFQIAKTALDLWKAEVDESYQCFEHFLIESGRGAGWHQFSALSSPVLAWFAAYYRPGRLTAGFDTWIHRCDLGPDDSALSAELELRARSGGNATVLVNLRPEHTYRAQWNGTPVPLRPTESGTLQVALHRDAGREDQGGERHPWEGEGQDRRQGKGVGGMPGRGSTYSITSSPKCLAKLGNER